MVGPGLLPACISDFANLKESDEPNTLGQLYNGSDIHSPTYLAGGETDHRCDYMARDSRMAPLKVVTCGLERLEDDVRSHISAAHIKDKYAGLSRKFDMKGKEDELAVLRQAFYNVYPRSITEHILFVGCRRFDNPNATAELRRHVGYHPTILELVGDRLRGPTPHPNL